MDLRENKKILFVINTLGLAGAEVALISLLKRFMANDRDVYLYVLTGQGELISDIPSDVHILNKKYINDSVLTKSGKRKLIISVLKRALISFKLFLFIPYFIKHFFIMYKKGHIYPEKLAWQLLADTADRFDMKFDMAVAFLEGGSAYYVGRHVKANTKVGFIHIDYGKAGYYCSLDKDIYLNFNKIFAVSSEVKEAFLKEYPECAHKIDVYNNIIDLDRITNLSHMGTGFDDDFFGTRLLSVGRLTEQKNFTLCIETMKILKDNDIRWYICGEGPMRTTLERQIEKEHLKGKLVLLGSTDNPYKYMRQCDIYIHPSIFEGKSIAVEEAMLLECPVILTDVSGNREQIKNGVDGIMCDNNPIKMAEAIKRLIYNHELARRLAAEARKNKINSINDNNKLDEVLEEE